MNAPHFSLRYKQGISLLAMATLLTISTVHADESDFGTHHTNKTNFGTGFADEFQPPFPQAVDAQILDTQRARALPTQQLSDNNSNIDLRDNLVDGTNHGTNNVHQGAFQGVHGIATVIQNTGHNVAIQESMNINIAINPGR